MYSGKSDGKKSAAGTRTDDDREEGSRKSTRSNLDFVPTRINDSDGKCASHCIGRYTGITVNIVFNASLLAAGKLNGGSRVTERNIRNSDNCEEAIPEQRELRCGMFWQESTSMIHFHLPCLVYEGSFRVNL